jgi:glycosyltransferase involved in cell wall biosynthesis
MTQPQEKISQRVLISGGLAVGGPQTHVTILCKTLREAGADVTIAASATNWNQESLRDLRQSGVRVIVSPFGFGRLSVLGKVFCFALWPLLLRRNFDVVYCIGEGRMHAFASKFCRPGGWRVYHEIVECPLPGSVGYQIGQKMDAIIGNSKKVSDELKLLFPDLPIRRIAFLTTSASMEYKARPSVTPTSFINVSYLGRLVSHKRPAELISVWKELQQNGSFGPSKLNIYGGDHGTGLQANLQLQIDELGIGDSVCLHGPYVISSLAKILERTDLVVLPSLVEGLPLVLAEAMIRGIPVVATSAGGTSELGTENPDVIITTGTDWSKFVDGLVEMMARIRRSEIDSFRLHRWTEDRYGFDATSSQWLKALLNPDDYFGKRADSLMLDSPPRRDEVKQ